MMRNSVGIIGFGRFGQLVASNLSGSCDVIVTNRSDKHIEAEALGVAYGSIEECASCKNVVLCVPISVVKDTLHDILPHLRPGARVFDVCSVKSLPCKWLDDMVPKECRCVGTHPLFGPDTASSGLKGHRVVLCNPRCDDISDIVTFLKNLGLEVIETTPENHDRQMAHSLALIHFLGRSLSNIGIMSVEISTVTHERLKELVNITENDSPQLLVDMHKYNPYAKEVRKQLINELNSLDAYLSSLEN